MFSKSLLNYLKKNTMKKYGIWIFVGFIFLGLLAGCTVSQNPQTLQAQLSEQTPSSLPTTASNHNLPVKSTPRTCDPIHLFSGSILITSTQPGKLYLYDGASLTSIQISTDDIHQPAPRLERSVNEN